MKYLHITITAVASYFYFESFVGACAIEGDRLKPICFSRVRLELCELTESEEEN